MSSNNSIRSTPSITSSHEANHQQYCPRKTRTRSGSSASDDPTRKRMAHITTRLKNAFRISHQPMPSSSYSSPSSFSVPSHPTDSVFPSSAPMHVRSLSLPSSHQYQQQTYYFPTTDQFMPKSRPLSCVFEQSTDVGSIQEETDAADVQEGSGDHHATAMELDPSSSEIETPTRVPSLMTDSACSSTVSEVDSLHSAPMTVDKEEEEEEEDEGTFVYEQQTEWVNTAKHWYSDYKLPFHSKSAQATEGRPPLIHRPPKRPQEGILKRPGPHPSTNEIAPSTTTVLGKRPMSANTQQQQQQQQQQRQQQRQQRQTSSALSSLPSVLGGNNSGGNGSPFHKNKKRTPVIRFDKMIQVHATYSQQDYNRQSDPDAICTRLNATLAHQIKQELNLYKTTEMFIHEQSKVYTQLFC